MYNNKKYFFPGDQSEHKGWCYVSSGFPSSALWCKANLHFFVLSSWLQVKRWSRCTLTSVCSACGKAASTQSCWTTMTSCDLTHILLSCRPVVSRLSLLYGHRAFGWRASERPIIGLCGRAAAATGWPCRFSQSNTFSPLSIFTFCLSLREKRKRGTRKRTRSGVLIILA